MHLFINPKYESLRPYLSQLSSHFVHEGQPILHGSHEVRLLQADGIALCVRHYEWPTLRQRLVHRLYGTSKGRKAFFHPLQLRERGFESPEPVAYLSMRRSLTRNDSYYVCRQPRHTETLAACEELPPATRSELIAQFGRFAARLHEDGFLHRDFTADNVLYGLEQGRYRFSLIDTSRLMCTHRVGLERGCKNLAQLGLSEAAYRRLMPAYAAARHADEEQCWQYFTRATRRTNASHS